MPLPLYRKRDNWILAACVVCHTKNYVEPHGTTGQCRVCGKKREHLPLTK